MKITAVGDYLQMRRILPEMSGVSDIRDFLARGDMRFANLETTIHREGVCFASQFNGGAYVRSEPEILCDLKMYGFNAVSTANNHSLDYACTGVTETLRHLGEAGIPACGTGRNLDQAAAPVYIDMPTGRVALISVTSTFDPSAMAGRQSRRVPGRPGVNGLRFIKEYRVTGEQLNTLREIARTTAINGYDDILRSEGFMPEGEGEALDFGGMRFVRGDIPSQTSRTDAMDMQRVGQAIDEARYQADYVVISLHSHEVRFADKREPADFAVEFAHACIDRGACAVIGHGPHQLRPIELYKGKPIFYSLGNFVFHNENTLTAPEEQFMQFGMTSDATLRSYFEQRSDNGRRGLLSKPETFESIAVCIEFDGQKLAAVTLMPLEMGHGKPRSVYGTPYPASDAAGVIERLALLSAPYGVKIGPVNSSGLAQLEL